MRRKTQSRISSEIRAVLRKARIRNGSRSEELSGLLQRQGQITEKGRIVRYSHEKEKERENSINDKKKTGLCSNRQQKRKWKTGREGDDIDMSVDREQEWGKNERKTIHVKT